MLNIGPAAGNARPGVIACPPGGYGCIYWTAQTSMPTDTVRRRAAAILPGAIVVLAMLMFFVTEAIRSLAFHNTPIAQIVWLRYGFHLVLMLAIFGAPARLRFLATARPGLQIFRSLLMLAMPMCYVLAAQRARSADVLAVFAISTATIAPRGSSDALRSWPEPLIASSCTALATLLSTCGEP